MTSYPRGLNYLPLLEKNTSPLSSTRSRISAATRRSHQSLVSYYGNYEGDASMFKNRGFALERLDLVDTDSETEYKKDLEKYISSRSIVEIPVQNDSFLWRFLESWLIRFVKPDTRLKVTEFFEKVQNNALYNSLQNCTKFLIVIFLWLLHLLVVCFNKIDNWKIRSLFRNSSRRLLWWMTMAKCGDLSLFALILLCTPLLIVIAVFGFIISLYSGLKQCLQRMGIFIKTRII